jgi:FMN phosphatase YigB (HAD superfamily)
MPIMKGIGFDLFGTLVLQERFSFEQCIDALILACDPAVFRSKRTRLSQPIARSTDDLWSRQRRMGARRTIDCGLPERYKPSGMQLTPAIPVSMRRLKLFEPFVRSCQLIPGTYDMLASLAGRYRLGLVSNFTHPPAVEQILARVGRRFLTRSSFQGAWGLQTSSSHLQ